MQVTLELVVSIVGIIVTSVVGVILSNLIATQKRTINSMSSTIESMKSFVEIFDIEKVKSYTELSKEAAELEMKKKFEKLVKELIDTKIVSVTEGQARAAAEAYIEKNADFLESYEELMSIHVNMLLDMNAEQREAYLKNYPKNAPMIRRFLAAIDRGEVAPGSSFDKKKSKPNKP